MTRITRPDNRYITATKRVNKSERAAENRKATDNTSHTIDNDKQNALRALKQTLNSIASNDPTAYKKMLEAIFRITLRKGLLGEDMVDSNWTSVEQVLIEKALSEPQLISALQQFLQENKS